MLTEVTTSLIGTILEMRLHYYTLLRYSELKRCLQVRTGIGDICMRYMCAGLNPFKVGDLYAGHVCS